MTAVPPPQIRLRPRGRDYCTAPKKRSKLVEDPFTECCMCGIQLGGFLTTNPHAKQQKKSSVLLSCGHVTCQDCQYKAITKEQARVGKVQNQHSETHFTCPGCDSYVFSINLPHLHDVPFPLCHTSGCTSLGTISYCVQCNRNYCIRCRKHHDANSSYRLHSINFVQTAKNSTVFTKKFAGCNRHGVLNNGKCSGCGDLVCNQCTSDYTENRGGHMVHHQQTTLGDVSLELEDAMKNVIEYEMQIHQMEKSARRRRIEFQNQADLMKNEISVHFYAMINTIMGRYYQVMQTVTEEETKVLNKYLEVERRCNDANRRIVVACELDERSRNSDVNTDLSADMVYKSLALTIFKPFVNAFQDARNLLESLKTTPIQLELREVNTLQIMEALSHWGILCLSSCDDVKQGSVRHFSIPAFNVTNSWDNKTPVPPLNSANILKTKTMSIKQIIPRAPQPLFYLSMFRAIYQSLVEKNPPPTQFPVPTLITNSDSERMSVRTITSAKHQHQYKRVQPQEMPNQPSTSNATASTSKPTLTLRSVLEEVTASTSRETIVVGGPSLASALAASKAPSNHDRMNTDQMQPSTSKSTPTPSANNKPSRANDVEFCNWCKDVLHKQQVWYSTYKMFLPAPEHPSRLPACLQKTAFGEIPTELKKDLVPFHNTLMERYPNMSMEVRNAICFTLIKYNIHRKIEWDLSRPEVEKIQADLIRDWNILPKKDCEVSSSSSSSSSASGAAQTPNGANPKDPPVQLQPQQPIIVQKPPVTMPSARRDENGVGEATNTVPKIVIANNAILTSKPVEMNGGAVVVPVHGNSNNNNTNGSATENLPRREDNVGRPPTMGVKRLAEVQSEEAAVYKRPRSQSPVNKTAGARTPSKNDAVEEAPQPPARIIMKIRRDPSVDTLVASTSSISPNMKPSPTGVTSPPRNRAAATPERTFSIVRKPVPSQKAKDAAASASLLAAPSTPPRKSSRADTPKSSSKPHKKPAAAIVAATTAKLHQQAMQDIEDEERNTDSPSSETSEKQLDEDGTHSFCWVCNDARVNSEENKGICSNCPRIYHRECHLPPVEQEWDTIPDDWVCTICAPTPASNPDLAEMDEDARTLCSKVILSCYENPKAVAHFAMPVSDTVANYKAVISQPMDFDTISKRLQAEHPETIKSTLEFIQLMNLVFQNCAKFNSKDSAVSVAARKVWRFYQISVKKYLPHHMKDVWLYVYLNHTTSKKT